VVNIVVAHSYMLIQCAHLAVGLLAFRSRLVVMVSGR
jgi:hypothetical protein